MFLNEKISLILSKSFESESLYSTKTHSVLIDDFMHACAFSNDYIVIKQVLKWHTIIVSKPKSYLIGTTNTMGTLEKT